MTEPPGSVFSCPYFAISKTFRNIAVLKHSTRTEINRPQSVGGFFMSVTQHMINA